MYQLGYGGSQQCLAWCFILQAPFPSPFHCVECEVARWLATLDGQRELLGVLAKRKALTNRSFFLGGQTMAAVVSFVPLIDVMHVKAVNKTLCEQVRHSFSSRCESEFVLSPDDFPMGERRLPLMVAFVHHERLRNIRVLNVSRLPASDTCHSLLWAALCTLDRLERVVVDHQAALQIPDMPARRFLLQVKLQ